MVGSVAKNIKLKKIYNKKVVPKNAFNNLKSYLKLHPIWSFEYVDVNIDKWNLIKNINSDILDHLKSFEGLSWSEIQQASGGKKKGTNNHYVPIFDLSTEAKNEIKKLKYLSENLQAIFSLRLTSLIRLYGIIDESTGIFKIVWFDKKHEIYYIDD